MERAAQRKADAGNRSAWNTLFMRPDTVAEAIAAHFGISKMELLDPAASDLPVRMALGEAQVMAQTKQALADAGAQWHVGRGRSRGRDSGGTGGTEVQVGHRQNRRSLMQVHNGMWAGRAVAAEAGARWEM